MEVWLSSLIQGRDRFACIGWQVILCDPIRKRECETSAAHCWLGALETEMSTACVGHKAVRGPVDYRQFFNINLLNALSSKISELVFLHHFANQ